MSGQRPARRVGDDERVRWVRALTAAGWLFLLAYLGQVTALVRRAAAIDEGSFEDGLWWQRVEQVSFLAVPQNLVVLAPAAAAAVAGVLLARDVADPASLWLAQLVRVTAGTCYVVIAVAALGIVGIYARSPDSVGDLESLLGRGGGILMAVAMIRVCLEAERTA